MEKYVLQNKDYSQEDFNKAYNEALNDMLSAFSGTTLFKQG